MIARLLPLALLSLAGCSDDAQQRHEPPVEAATAAPSMGPASATASSAETARTARHTRLDDCRVVRESRDEMPFTESRCPGPAGWALEIADSDARQTMAVISPDGRKTRLGTARIGGGGFSNFGDVAEWRGPASKPFAPDALIVRYQVAEQPHPAAETSYLLAVRLAPEPCIVVRIAPGDQQNERARFEADGVSECARD